MVGSIVRYNGQSWRLPELLSWQLLRTDGDGCDAFTVSFAADAATDAQLAGATEFLAQEGSRQVFHGIVDDYELSYSTRGSVCTLSGRGMAGRLLDNQAEAASYASASLPQILQKYVSVLDVKASAETLPAVQDFTVPIGTNYWEVLKGFCLHAGAVTPWCGADGTVQIAKAYSNSGKTFSEGQALSIVYCNSRYGVISQMLQITTAGAVLSASNADFAAIGGRAKKVQRLSGTGLPCTHRTPAQQIAESRVQQFQLQLELAGNFLAEPNTWVTVSLPTLGISGRFRVSQCMSEGSERGVTCTLSLTRE